MWSADHAICTTKEAKVEVTALCPSTSNINPVEEPTTDSTSPPRKTRELYNN